MEKDEKNSPEFSELAPAIEFMAWVVVALFPLLRIVNGAAVTAL